MNREGRKSWGAGRVCWGLAEKATFEQSLGADAGWVSPYVNLKEKLSVRDSQEAGRSGAARTREKAVGGQGSPEPVEPRRPLCLAFTPSEMEALHRRHKQLVFQ